MLDTVFGDLDTEVNKETKKLLLFCEPIPSLKNNQPQTS